jgi:elongation factor G
LILPANGSAIVLKTNAAVDAPSTAKRGSARAEPPFLVDGASTAAFVFKTIADPFAGKINLFRVLKGEVTTETTLIDHREHGKERMGSLLTLQGKTNAPARELGEGDVGAVAKLKDVQTGDLLTDVEVDVEPPSFGFPEPVMSFAVTPKIKGEEEKVATAIRRLAEEDPTLRLRRDPQTGEEILAGMSQMHVEVALERAKRRFGVDVELHQPRVPYLETIRKESRARHRYKKQTGGRGQFGDCEIVLVPIEGHEGYEFVDKIVGGVIPQSFRPAVDKGIQEAMQHGELAGAPVQGVRVQLVDGQYHNVDSSEMAFKIAGSMALKDAVEKADPTILEPVMRVEVTMPEEFMGDVIGDLNSRRGQIEGMEVRGTTQVVRAFVPLAQMFGYVTDLRSMTQGRASSSMEFSHYAEVPASVASELVQKSKV